ELYQVVLDAHETAMAALKPGVLYKDIHLLACRTLTDGLKQVGLMRGDTEEAVQAGAHTMFFQCGLGHMMGMDVHDMENLGEQYVGYTAELRKSTEFGLKSLRLGRALEPGFVLTVEPGIYIIPELIDMRRNDKVAQQFINFEKLDTYRDFGGIRIEDDLLITENGSRILGEPLPKTIAEVEAIRQQVL
ncbi:MAG TPA: M24 family metallopeptidase, partial [Pontibacter sp.]